MKNIKPLFAIVSIFSLFAFTSNVQANSVTNILDNGIKEIGNYFSSLNLVQHDHEDETNVEHHKATEHGGETHKTEEHEGGGHHGPDTSLLFFVIVAVFIGAATRHFLKKIPVPFTALLLIIGMILGVITRMGGFEHWGTVDVSFIADSFAAAAHIDPHMLLYVFLPILIFEAAFAMDLHTFKKSATNSVILAVPGIVIALVLTACMVVGIDMLGIGLPGWANWSLALMFGSVISATDPVAVVALLKELGASKKLGTLIEGESLLNDGTAIVIFMVFFALLTGDTSGANGFVQFAVVSFGGIAIGVIIGWIMLKWIKKVFNDAMVEITAVVAAAYVTFYIAEHFLHVSGVLALVALGLMLGGAGRSTISPQVEHFMHEFWELAGFIANCLIFLIVGLVIAERTEFTANDFLVLGIVYIGIHIVRAIVIVIHYPFMKKTGYGLPVKDAIVVWYGALRGAIGLALALIVMGIDAGTMAEVMNNTSGTNEMTAETVETIKNQFLFLIAGTVTLTLLVNATTIKALVNYLGLLDVAPAKAIMIYNANEYLKESSDTHMESIKSDRYLKKANWDVVSEYLPKPPSIDDDVKNAKIETIAETRRRLLEKEKSSYWRQFKDGLLSPDAVQGLSDGTNNLLDAGGSLPLSDRDDLEESWEAPKWMQKCSQTPLINKMGERMLVSRLAKSYDSAVGFIAAQDECISLLESISRSKEVPENEIATIEEELNENKIHAQAFIRNLRKNYSDIYNTISTQQAIRNMLNYEHHTIDRLLKKGRIDSGEAEKMLASLKERSKKLIDSPPAVIKTEKKEKKIKPTE
jgi:NhaP-type Na+/H+ or K+/H+ antiporter